MRVVLAHHVADYPGALGPSAIRPVAAVIHRVENTDVHGLETVAHIGESAADDDRHRVVDIALLHLDLDVDRLKPAAWLVGTAVVAGAARLAWPSGPDGAAWALSAWRSFLPGHLSLWRVHAHADLLQAQSSKTAGRGGGPTARCPGNGHPWRCAG